MYQMNVFTSRGIKDLLPCYAVEVAPEAEEDSESSSASLKPKTDMNNLKPQGSYRIAVENEERPLTPKSSSSSSDVSLKDRIEEELENLNRDSKVSKVSKDPYECRLSSSPVRNEE